MTRDEAIATLQSELPVNGSAWIDAFVKLGMFEFEEPKSASNKFADILARFFPGPEVEEVWREMDEANIQITEKQEP